MNALATLLVVGLAGGVGGGGHAPGIERLHEIHSTLTVVTVDRTGLVLRIRSFADDLSASVAAMAGRPAPPDSSVIAAEVDRYVRAKVRVTDRAGRAVALAPCGIERVRDAYLLCYRVEGRPGETVARLANELLTERHADQVNIVQFVRGDARRSVLLTLGSAPAEVPAH